MRFGCFVGQDVAYSGDTAVVVGEAVAEARRRAWRHVERRGRAPDEADIRTTIAAYSR